MHRRVRSHVSLYHAPESESPTATKDAARTPRDGEHFPVRNHKRVRSDSAMLRPLRSEPLSEESLFSRKSSRGSTAFDMRSDSQETVAEEEKRQNKTEPEEEPESPSRSRSSSQVSDVSCTTKSTIRSTASETPVKLQVFNRSGETLGCRWIDYEGRDDVLSLDLPSGKCVTLNTYSTHPWKFVGLTSGLSHAIYVCSQEPVQALSIRMQAYKPPASGTGVGSSSAAEASERGPVAPPPPAQKSKKPVQENPNRCWCCDKKVPLALQAVPCRCGYTFCKKHRQPEDHDCGFDYKATQRQELADQNQRVVADKLENRV